MTTPLDLDAIRARSDRAAEHVGRLCTKEDRWKMSVPPREDDSDVLLTAVAHEDVPALLDEVKRLASLLAYTRESRDAYAATLDRVAAIVEPPHIATLENLSEVIDCARAPIEGTDS